VHHRNVKAAGCASTQRDGQTGIADQQSSPVLSRNHHPTQDQAARLPQGGSGKPPVRAQLFVADGRRHAGTVERCSRAYIARDAHGHRIGRFRSLQAAVRAIPARGRP
jgi:hypothetical protein